MTGQAFDREQLSALIESHLEYSINSYDRPGVVKSLTSAILALPQPEPQEVTDEMVERGAMVLWAEGSARGEWSYRPSTYPYGRLIEETKNDLRAYARAVLVAALSRVPGSSK